MVSFSLTAQISFHRVYSGEGYDFGYDLFQVEDSSYYLCGASSSFDDGPSQAILLKVDSLGNSIWSKAFGGSGQEAFLSMDRAADYGIYAGGYSTTNTSGGFDGYLARLDFDGNKVWDTLLGGSDWDRIVAVKSTIDSGVVVVSNTKSFGNNGEDWWVHRLDKFGTVTWELLLGGAYDDVAKDCEINADTIYVVGSHYIVDSSLQKAVVYRLDLNSGQIYGADTMNILGNSIVNDVEVFPNGVSFVGACFLEFADSSDMMYGALTPDGDFGYIGIEVNQGYESSNCFSPSLDSTTLYINKQAAYSPHLPTYGDGLQDSKVYEFTSDFYFLPSGVSYSDFGDDITENIIATNDDGFAYVGHQVKYTENKTSLYLVKIGPNGEAPPIQDPVISDIIGASLFVENHLDKEDDISIYPNPFKSQINVVLAGNSEQDVDAINLVGIDGQVVLSVLKPNNHETLNLVDLAPGSYFLNVVQQGAVSVYKVVKL